MSTGSTPIVEPISEMSDTIIGAEPNTGIQINTGHNPGPGVNSKALEAQNLDTNPSAGLCSSAETTPVAVAEPRFDATVCAGFNRNAAARSTTHVNMTTGATETPAGADSKADQSPPSASGSLPSQPEDLQSFTLTCYISSVWVAVWAQTEKTLRLCFGFAVQGKTKYVIVKTEAIIPHVVPLQSSAASSEWTPIKLEWTDDYQIAASETAFHVNGNLSIDTDIVQPISFGERYIVSWNGTKWIPQKSVPDPKAPDNGFRLQLTNHVGACVLAKSFNNQTTPFYISPVLLPLSGKSADTLIPENLLAVWFDRAAIDGQMVIDHPPENALGRSVMPQDPGPQVFDPKDHNSNGSRLSPITVQRKDPFTKKYRVPLIRRNMEVHYDVDGYWQSGAPNPSEDVTGADSM